MVAGTLQKKSQVKVRARELGGGGGKVKAGCVCGTMYM